MNINKRETYSDEICDPGHLNADDRKVLDQMVKVYNAGLEAVLEDDPTIRAAIHGGQLESIGISTEETDYDYDHEDPYCIDLAKELGAVYLEGFDVPITGDPLKDMQLRSSLYFLMKTLGSRERAALKTQKRV